VPNLADPNFFKALFDFSFSQFITVKFASFIYAAALILVGLGYVGVVISALSQNILAGFGALIFGALVALLYVIFIRIGLEFSVAMIRTAQNTTKIAEKQD
jgi:protein-S-isoprenylcysteine O-methyltransferase Ste14